ncbi:MAG: hypothetical protein SGBAC_005965 [Bacillariaceae sp.]
MVEVFSFIPPIYSIAKRFYKCQTKTLYFYRIHWLDSEAQEVSKEDEIPLGESIAEGECVLAIPNVVSTDECQLLFQAALQARDRRDTAAARGRSRFSVSDPNNFANPNIVLTCEEVLLRAIDYLEEASPSIYETLFAPGPNWCEWQPLNAQLEQPSTPPDDEVFDGLRELYVMSQLEWSEGEPAINVYEKQGYFGCHKDHLALTVLVPLLNPGESFSGGGTGFWAGNRDTSENPGTPPTMVLKPPAGTALVFGGDVTHSGMPVEQGLRSVLVCSFSTKTATSNPDRLHGLHAPPTSSADFKGTL